MSKEVQVLDKTFVPYLSAEAIHESVAKLGQQICDDYKGKDPLFIAILNGSFMFTSDLFKTIDIPAEICFIKLASYKGTKSSGHVITAIGLDAVIKDRHVVILEDIVDTGKTLTAFLPEIMNQQPASLAICALLHKPEAMVHPLDISYIGFSIPNRFVVGYGLDYDGYGRNLPEIYQLKD
ncbi:MAG TPA: hypoxanthine phosphoribosyltransferase [Phnomibacter sp.]|nr:hypoxanthine phosphoribosyltransferase [Phnomibacter sp.]